MKLRFSCLFLVLFALAFLPINLSAQESPEALYKKWVETCKAGDVQGLLDLSTKAKLKEFRDEHDTPEQIAEMKKMMMEFSPISYTVKSTQISPDGNKASLWVEALEKPFFSDKKNPKPEKETVEVRLLKEDGKWKLDQTCNGKDGCGKEPEWIKAAYNKPIALPKNASLKVSKNQRPEFKSVKVEGQPYSVDFAFDFPENMSLFYFLHRSPSFAEFYIQAGDKKIAPVAQIESFPMNSGEEIKAQKLEDGVSYSKSHQFSGHGVASLLFDLPADAKGPKPLFFMVTVDDQKYSYEIP